MQAAVRKLAQEGRSRRWTRDPIAIGWRTGARRSSTPRRPDDEIIDLSKTAVGVKVAADALGCTRNRSQTHP
ncbi:MAG: hypothetical protein WKH64_07410 [Chloroflexia bacterium]